MTDQASADRRRRLNRAVLAGATWAPVVTFVLGVLAQQLLQELLVRFNLVLLGLLLITLGIGATAVILAIGAVNTSREISRLTETLDSNVAHVESTLEQLRSKSGLSVEYVSDAHVGASYGRISSLIKSARESLTFVDLWEPFDGYQTRDGSNGDTTLEARNDYYQAIRNALDAHVTDTNVFHKRIVQVPQNLLDGPIPFGVDPPYSEYLAHAIGLQERFPLACRLRLAPALIRLHFIIIDERHIVIPILSHDMQGQQQIRFGALLFEDRGGSLLVCLHEMYSLIEAKSAPLQARHVAPPQVVELPSDRSSGSVNSHD